MKEIMFYECANPECGVALDYREGRFFRFHKSHLPGEAPPNTHSAQHFWLCGKCSEEFMLEYVGGQGVVMMHRLELRGEFEPSRSIAVAWISFFSLLGRITLSLILRVPFSI